MEIGDPRTRIFILVVAAVMALGIAGYLWLGQAQPNQEYSGTVEKITVANTQEYSTLIWIAEEQGYFTTNGLDITFIDYQAGKLAADALLAGEADISISAEFVLVSYSFDNTDLRTLGTVDTVENLELVARKDTGIADPGDLKGKTIGITRKSVGEFFLGRFLIFHGLSIADVEVVDLTPKEMVAAISNGDIDAGLVWQPSVFTMKNALGDNAISWSGQSGERYNMILIARETFIRDNTEAIDRFIKSIV
ncbi:MAG: NrtA/SsuA/CpmA family ABC transporter substrate-binding protein, partial [Nitrososphaerales archaeon]